VLQQEHALSLVLAALEPLDTRHLLLPVSFISRLITTAQEVFAVQYVQVRVLYMVLRPGYCCVNFVRGGLWRERSMAGCR